MYILYMCSSLGRRRNEVHSLDVGIIFGSWASQPVFAPPNHFYVGVPCATWCWRSALCTFPALGGARRPRLKMVSPLTSRLHSRTFHIQHPTSHRPAPTHTFHLHIPHLTFNMPPLASHLSARVYHLAHPTCHHLLVTSRILSLTSQPPTSQLEPVASKPWYSI